MLSKWRFIYSFIHSFIPIKYLTNSLQLQTDAESGVESSGRKAVEQPIPSDSRRSRHWTGNYKRRGRRRRRLPLSCDQQSRSPSGVCRNSPPCTLYVRFNSNYYDPAAASIGRRHNALMAVVCLSVCLSVCPLSDHKSRTGHSKLKIDRKEAHDTGDPWPRLKVERSKVKVARRLWVAVQIATSRSERGILWRPQQHRSHRLFLVCFRGILQCFDTGRASGK